MKEKTNGLYDKSFEKDACGIGFVAHLKGERSHDLVVNALKMLARMGHRGACGCDPNSGDGAGILMQIPHEFFAKEAKRLKLDLPEFGNYGVGLLFLPTDKKAREESKKIFEANIKKIGLKLIGYRKVPTDNSPLGPTAKEVEPEMEHVFIEKPAAVKDPEDFERKLFILRNYTRRTVYEKVKNLNSQFHIATLSYKTIAFKGQLTTDQVMPYFPDLDNPEVKTAIALVHSRFSTNTFPEWRLAQPFRYIAHNGEINTMRGNLNWMKAREAMLKSNKFTKEELEMAFPITDPTQSDSANLDNAVELLYLSGFTLPQVMMMLVPEAWQENPLMDQHKRDFYEYHACIMEPWDGPASICFTDGKTVGATLDRNGLRPSRYSVTEDGLLVMASETGVLELDQSKVIQKGRLQPGKIFVASLEEGRIISDDEIKKDLCNKEPYGDWLAKNKLNIADVVKSKPKQAKVDEEMLLNRQQVFGYSSEDLKVILGPMAEAGKEPTGSMGNDTPIAILSDQAQHLSNYFKQLFAQVTNPPIDPIRERSVMSLFMFLGGYRNMLKPTEEHCKVIQVDQPVLRNEEIESLKNIKHKDYKSAVVDILFDASGKKGALEKALDKISDEAAKAVKKGNNILILSDKKVDSKNAPIPSLLATAAIHHHLIREGLRGNTSIVVESGDVRETHHFATLIGFGASAVNPYLAFESILSLKGNIIKKDLDTNKLLENYIKAIGAGLLKILSKMGISTLQSYHGAQIFEALGIKKSVIDKYFTRTISRIEGVGLDEIAREALIKHTVAFPSKPIPNPHLEVGGVYQWKRRGEFHLFNPETIHLLQKATRTDNYQAYKKYSELVNKQEQSACTLRSLLEFKEGNPVPLHEVEPVEEIFKRFATGAMSFGSISYEAHTTLAIAMNRIGGKSNSGEGGEDERRFVPKENGDWERSAIKQVASGRFGVTSYYLTNADELQIKIAQGAKPGEGGQLPGHKVDDWIARVRHSTPGVGLISPPPHHDIYSIEDLAQLIFDLKRANRAARISVKLVSEAGVGTIAAGVAKAHSDHILISGHDGGTGASPISSIKHAGLPWELGLAETHQTLVRNDLRSRVTVQTDGQIKTGRDLAIATLLGAEEWGVATAALVVEGCIMMRKCHLNTCPVGIATQNKTLRERYTGDPDHVVTFFRFLAEELREIMAELGFRTIEEMVGQVQMLKKRDDIDHWKYKELDLSPILYKEPNSDKVGIFKQIEQDHEIEKQLDWVMLEKGKEGLEKGKKVQAELKIKNIDRAVGTIFSNEISKKYNDDGLPEGTLHFKFNGSAGQSFGAFGAKGLRLELEGDANDYFGKGLSGAQLVVYPDAKAPFKPSENMVIGNVALYGATSGEVYIRGLAGERFAVRNSGAKAVVEGIGDHGCEYMTGGLVVVIGDTGRNFAAGMSGGIAYILDEKKDFADKCNHEMVDLDPIKTEDEKTIKGLVKNHYTLTGSDVAKALLDNWDKQIKKFVKVMPRDYKAVLEKRKHNKGASERKEEIIHG